MNDQTQSKHSLRTWLALATDLQQDAEVIGFTSRRQIDRSLALFDTLVTVEELRSATRELFKDGHYANSVERAFICIDNAVRRKSDLTLTGDRLMRNAFSANNPRLQLNRLQNESDENEQRGYMDIFAGAMVGIRNPRAHEHLIEDELDTAIELLTLANHLMRKLDATVRKCRTSIEA